jgi:hypothetical protein
MTLNAFVVSVVLVHLSWPALISRPAASSITPIFFGIKVGLAGPPHLIQQAGVGLAGERLVGPDVVLQVDLDRDLLAVGVGPGWTGRSEIAKISWSKLVHKVDILALIIGIEVQKASTEGRRGRRMHAYLRGRGVGGTSHNDRRVSGRPFDSVLDLS